MARTYKDAPNVDGYLFVNTQRELMTGDFSCVSPGKPVISVVLIQISGISRRSFPGNYRSVPVESLVKEAESLAEEGVRELVIVAQETTHE